MPSVDQVFLVYSVLVATASFIHLIRIDYWWIRMWDFPHLQLTVLSSFGFLAWLVLVTDFSWPQVLVPVLLGASMLYQGWLIYPYTPLGGVQVIRARRAQPERNPNAIRLLIANVLMTNTQCPKVLALARKHEPDVVLILEANEQWRRELSELEDAYPHRKLYPLENTYGMLLYSKLPMHDTELRFMIQEDIPSIHTQFELPSGLRVFFHGVHPMPPSPTEHYRSTERDAELLLVGKETRRHGGPTIVAGDLNDVAWSHSTRLFQRISGLLDPRVGRGLYSTFHANYFFLRWPLDHVFVSHHFRLQRLRRLPNCGSDHFPILVSLVYDPDAERATEAPRPEKDDIREARETIEEARESEA